MKTYKVIFAKNEIVTCIESNAKLPREKDMLVERHNGHLVHVLVRATDIGDACVKVLSSNKL